MIIAIDGPSGTGKSTVARGAAKKLGFTFFDTGAMYRSAAWWVLQRGIDPENESDVNGMMASFVYEIKADKDRERRYFVSGTDVTEAIRSPEISAAASKIAAYPFIRSELVKIQRGFGRRSDAVFEGRDMGTVVFPNAEVKIFLTAAPVERARRRYRELLAKFPDMADEFSEEQILRDIEKRDHDDSTRAVSPLKQAPDAILIDTSDLTVEQVIDRIVSLANEKRDSFVPMRFTYRIIRRMALWYLRVFYRLKIFGVSHYRPGAAIIAANHASNLDPPIVSTCCPEEVHFLAKESLFRKPLLGALIRHLNSHPVSREASDAATFRLIISILQGGQKVILFPEGKRTFDGQLQPIERGLPFLMMKAKCPIQPIYIEGSFEAWPRGKFLPNFTGHIRCAFGSQIRWEDFESMERKEAEKAIIEKMGASLAGLKKWLEEGAVGSPP